MSSDFLSLLYTKSSECVRRNQFKGRNTVFVPDFFILILWMTVFLPNIVLDITVIYCLISQKAWGALVALGICSFLHSACELLINTTPLDRRSFTCHTTALFIIFLFGYGPIVICLKIIIVNCRIWKSFPLNSGIFPYPIFYVSNEDFSILKTYCFIYVVLKGIPQIFVLCTLLGEFKGNIWFILTACIFINMLIFSQMVASVIPIRKTPAYYLTSGSVILNAMIKYMATMCACCIQVELFSMVFREMRYYAVLPHIVLSLVWLWPCWHVIKSQPTPLTKLEFMIYLILFMLVFSFIYIHPFEKQGLVYYYIFYLVNLMSEIYVLYTWCNPNALEITYYFCLKIFLFGLLSCFGMVNILLRVTPTENKIYIVTQPTEGDPKSNENENEKEIKTESSI